MARGVFRAFSMPRSHLGRPQTVLKFLSSLDFCRFVLKISDIHRFHWFMYVHRQIFVYFICTSLGKSKFCTSCTSISIYVHLCRFCQYFQHILCLMQIWVYRFMWRPIHHSSNYPVSIDNLPHLPIARTPETPCLSMLAAPRKDRAWRRRFRSECKFM